VAEGMRAKFGQPVIVENKPGATISLGIGAMTDARMKDFFDKMVRAGVVKASLPFARSYTLQFVNKKVGLDLWPK
jgi:NitT/TauT family transport system substrate-binding protein